MLKAFIRIVGIFCFLQRVTSQNIMSQHGFNLLMVAAWLWGEWDWRKQYKKNAQK